MRSISRHAVCFSKWNTKSFLKDFESWLRASKITNVCAGGAVWGNIESCRVVFPIEGQAIVDEFLFKFGAPYDLLPNEILTKKGRFLIFKTLKEVKNYKEEFREIW